MLRRIFLVAAALSVTACIPAADPSRSGRRPPVVQTSESVRACVADLARMKARYTLLADRSFDGGCSANGSVQLFNIGVPVTNVTAIQCPMARTLTAWMHGTVQQAAADAFGERVVRMETMGAYACRNKIGGTGTGLSQHGLANAVDISAFILADGRRVAVTQGWNGRNDERQFLREVRDGACRSFRTVLSPDYNAAHYDHLHFDNGGRGLYCR